MGYVFDFKDAIAYEKWFDSPRNKMAAELEDRLLLNMLNPVHGRKLLDVGCGTGSRWSSLLKKGIDITGLDPSPYMLDIAREKIKHRADFHRGFGEDLPFDDDSFHYVSLITTLEYVNDPEKVLKEACRVAKDKIFIGINNRYAVKCLQHRVKGIFAETIYNRAKFFSIWEIRQMIRGILGDVPLVWKTTGPFPSIFKKYTYQIQRFHLMHLFPFGSFAGIVVTPVPRFMTTPLALRYKPRRAPAPNAEPLKQISEKGFSHKEDLGDGSLALRTI